MDGRDNNGHAGQTSCDSSIEICPGSVRLENCHSLPYEQSRQAPKGKGIEQWRQVNEMCLHSAIFHAFNKRTRFWADQERAKPSAVKAVKEKFQIPFTTSIGRRPGQFCEDDRRHGFLPRINKLPRKCG